VSDLVFIMDHESDGFTVEIFRTGTDSGRNLDYVGMISLFSNTLHIPGRSLAIDIPPALIGDRRAVEEWVATKL
jgi:hypothetical protein